MFMVQWNKFFSTIGGLFSVAGDAINRAIIVRISTVCCTI